uniref:Uncharacterized protein n=1 Tax=Aegilops tauschii subsp. strangulata TaxID=200361 RepID=A0A453QZ81_AEGTS
PAHKRLQPHKQPLVFLASSNSADTHHPTVSAHTLPKATSSLSSSLHTLHKTTSHLNMQGHAQPSRLHRPLTALTNYHDATPPCTNQ